MTIDAEEVKKNCDLAAIVGHYTPLVKKGREYVGRCIAHSPDEHPSMYVVPDKGFVHCFSCGFSSDIIGFIMEVESLDFEAALTRLNGDSPQWQPAISVPKAPPVPERMTSKPPAAAPTPKMGMKGLGEPSKLWPYKDADGGLLGYIARYDPADGAKKEIRAWTWGQRGEAPPSWGVGAFNKPRPLYGLDRLAQRPDAPVLIVEGEKAADAGQRLLPMYVAVTWSGGCQAWDKTDWLPIAKRKVLLLPDADAVGYAAMQKLANLLSDPAGLNCAVRVVDMDRMPESYDLADFEKDGWDAAKLRDWAKPRTADYIRKEAAKGPLNQAVAERGEGPPPIGLAEKPAKPKRQKKPPLTVVGGNSNLAEELDAEEVPLPYTEDGVAKQFVDQHYAIFRVCHDFTVNKTALWLTWDGSRWKREPARVTAMQHAVALSTSLRYQAERARIELSQKTKDRIGSKPFKGNFLDLSGFDRRLVSPAVLFDSHPLKLNTPGGTVDLATGDMYAQRQEDYLTRQTTVTPEEGPHPYFDNALYRLCAGDPAMRDYLLRSFGMSLTGDQREENFYFLLGAPQCGKTKLIEAIYKILGDTDTGGYAHKCSMDLFVETKHDKGSEALAHFNGARFVFTSETEEGRHWKAALLKLVCGGDTLDGRLLYQNKQSFTPTHHLWIFGNSQPHLKSSRDDGIRRRMHLIKYPGAIPDSERDKQFAEHLQAEYPAILHTLIKAAQEWLEIGLQPPASVVENVSRYMQAEDTIGQWLELCCALGEHAQTATSAAYESFKKWAEQNGEYIMSKKRFSQMLESRGFERGRGVDRYFIGFTLKDGPRQTEAELPLPELPPDWQDRF